MASRSLGSLTLDLLVKTGAFAAGMTAAERQANKSLSAIEKRAYKFGQALGTGLKVAAGVATVALGALTVAVSKAIDDADAIRDLSIRLGTSTETLSAFGYAAQQTGTDLDALGRGMKLLAKNAADALKPTSEQAAIFDAIGVSVTDAEGKLRGLGDLIPDIATAFQSMEDGTQKTALALALFGKSGADLIEFLNQGEAGLDEFTEKARRLGIVIDSETATAADEFNDTMADLKAIISGSALTIAKEMLPALQSAASALVRMAQQGDLASNAATILNSVVGAGVGALDLYTNAVQRTGIAMEFLARTQAAVASAPTKGILGGPAAVAEITSAYKDADLALQQLIKRQNSQFGDVRSRVLPGATGGGSVDSAALNRALSGQRPGGGSKSKGGKSDAEREADQLDAAYKRQNESLARQIALFGQAGEAAQLSYELQNGELAKLTAAQKDSLLVQAQKLDAMNLEKELSDAAADRLKQETEAYEDHTKAVADFIDDLKFEGELIGMNNLAREQAIALRYANVDAMSAEGQEIAGLVEKNMQLEESYSFAKDAQEGLADAFVEFASGAKSAKEAFGDFADELFKRALQFVADKAIQALFDSFSGENMSGSGNNDSGSLFDLFSGFFGGNKATGGAVMPGKFYRVNESGMEMATVGGRDYLMTGSKSGSITPAHKLGGGVNVQNQFVMAAPTSQRTQEQIAQRTGYEVSQAQRRNG